MITSPLGFQSLDTRAFRLWTIIFSRVGPKPVFQPRYRGSRVRILPYDLEMIGSDVTVTSNRPSIIHGVRSIFVNQQRKACLPVGTNMRVFAVQMPSPSPAHGCSSMSKIPITSGISAGSPVDGPLKIFGFAGNAMFDLGAALSWRRNEDRQIADVLQIR
ncbi:UNVERIFIED_ORG: hypothetical protein QE446_004785 [Rhizobium sp. SORGH_AS260]|uniref:hypothetical protein n=1 Tax=Agrobacterium sp. SORGH_AS_0440 TaxID=3041757 RepID=UPI00277FBAF5|nr:hypothetical protein [Agrobacterium sp. SORGH_AS_0440]MDP9734642.1 hypothetical protein [Rhizobium sp. SORGH_AS_0285]MDP9756861.1 hypothetical protein [Rhizobium sp. SORGH_AS_0260]MDR6083890.1 hypothetical protein [Agrobacterium sp. SORGH_AS_0440]